MKHLLFLLVFAALSPLSAEPAPGTPVPPASRKTPEIAPLTVKVTGLHSDKGAIRLAIHNTDTTFPKQWDKAFRVLTLPIPAGKTEVVVMIADLKPGSYALLAHHDEDGDGQIKRYWVGMPAEGMANSGTKPIMGAPAWKKSVFTLPETTELTLKLSYL